MLHRSLSWSSLSLFAGALGLMGCAGEPAEVDGSFPDMAYTTATSASGALRLELRTLPAQPPPRGLVTVEYTVRDAEGRPRDDLEMKITPWMPAMGHGTRTSFSVEPQGEGRYVASRLGLFMPGRWELRTTIDSPVSDSATVILQIP